MLLGTKSRLLAVRMVRVEGGEQCLIHLAAVLGKGHVLLLIDGLQLGVESPDHVVAETVSLDARPVVDLIGRNVLGVHGLVA